MDTTNNKIRALAFYLPQYHPIPENDRAWGRGFTEWTNVVQAKRLFKGHYQPHLPAELGLYDLRLPEVREEQARLAKAYGIYGFCYYHYWMHGHRLLERPFNEILRLGKPDFPFCLCWANEPWTRTWDGGAQDIIVPQEYSEADDLMHIRYLCREVFKDDRYIRVDGKPLFLIYRSTTLPNPQKTLLLWREEAKKYGLGLYLCRVESFGEMVNPHEIGFDASVEFQPEWISLFRRWPGLSLISSLRKTRYWKTIQNMLETLRGREKHWIFDYRTFALNNMNKPGPDYKRFPCVTPMFDNSPRRGKCATIVRGSTPELYELWLRNILGRFTPSSEDENFIFINAWNEWAEGCHLEPDLKWGRAYLAATRRALSNYSLSNR